MLNSWLIVGAALVIAWNCSSTLAGVYDSSALVQVNDPSGEYRSYFSAQPFQEEQWTLKVSTAVYGTDFIAFFATDNNRLVDTYTPIMILAS